MNMNRILTAKSTALVLTAAISGAVLGFYFGPRVAQAASAPQVVAFDRVINGKLDVFSPGVSYKLITTQNGADFAATQITSIKRHAHFHSTEFLYVVSGTGMVTLGTKRRVIGPGDMISIPMGTPHAFKANGPPLRFVEVDVPSIAANDIHWLP
ncbi:MAG: cupin domain-containing protein [Vulcanimicrobiaceae bacterium]|jgi:mannose-6-phosphate isomerase-like protein (cupin superfamily)